MKNDMYDLQEEYEKKFHKKAPCLIMMESESEYCEELENAIKRGRPIRDEERPEVDLIQEEDEINLKNKYNN